MFESGMSVAELHFCATTTMRVIRHGLGPHLHEFWADKLGRLCLRRGAQLKKTVSRRDLGAGYPTARNG